jgi:hypothetical protein
VSPTDWIYKEKGILLVWSIHYPLGDNALLVVVFQVFPHQMFELSMMILFAVQFVVEDNY